MHRRRFWRRLQEHIQRLLRLRIVAPLGEGAREREPGREAGWIGLGCFRREIDGIGRAGLHVKTRELHLGRGRTRRQLQRLLERLLRLCEMSLGDQYPAARELRRRRQTVRSDCRVSGFRRLVQLPLSAQQVGLCAQRHHVFRIGLEHAIDDRDRLVGPPIELSELGQPNSRDRSELGVRLHAVEERRGLVVAVLGDVVVGEPDGCASSRLRVGCRAQVRLGLRRASGELVEDGDEAVGALIARRHRDGFLHALLGLGRAARHPVVLREREARGHRRRVRGNRLLKRALGGGAIALAGLQHRQARVGRRLLRIQADRFLELLDGGIDILQTGHGAGEQHPRSCVLGSLGQRLLRARLGIVELSSHQEEVACLDLRVCGVGREIGGRGCVPQRVGSIAAAHVQRGQLLVGLRKLRIALNRVPVFDDRCVEVVRLDVIVAAFDVVAFGLLGASRTRRHSQDAQANGREIESGHNSVLWVIGETSSGTAACEHPAGPARRTGAPAPSLSFRRQDRDGQSG